MKRVKDRKKSKFFKGLSILLSLVLVGLSALFVYQLMNINILPEKLLIPVAIALCVFCLIFIVLLFFYTKHLVSKIIVAFLVICLCVGTGFGNFYLYKTFSAVEKISTKTEKKVKHTISVVAKSSSGIESLEDLDDKKVGKLKSMDAEGTKKSLADISKQLGVKKDKLPFTTKNANSVQEVINMLYEDKVDAIILNESYRQSVTSMEAFSDFDTATTVVYQTVYYTNETNEALAVSDITQTPFNILISGNDSYGAIGEEVSRSDVNMVVTVNPLTSTVLLTSIPRDAYVMHVCDVTDTCSNGGMDKLTHTGVHGVNVTRRTVENMLGIDINYTFLANFSSVTDIVDALGGIDVEVPEGMAVSKFYSDSTLEGVKEGKNHLDGKRALAFARERKAYLDGDLQRVRNQQIVLEAMFDKATSPTIITQYASLLDALGDAFETNLSANEIKDLIKFQLQTNAEWKFENYQVMGYGDMLVCADSGMELSVIVPYEDSIRIASDKIKAVLDGESSDTVEDRFDANESAGTLSKEDIEAQIEADLYGTSSGYDTGYYDPNLYTPPVYDPSIYDQNTYNPDTSANQDTTINPGYDPNAGGTDVGGVDTGGIVDPQPGQDSIQ